MRPDARRYGRRSTQRPGSPGVLAHRPGEGWEPCRGTAGAAGAVASSARRHRDGRRWWRCWPAPSWRAPPGAPEGGTSGEPSAGGTPSATSAPATTPAAPAEPSAEPSAPPQPPEAQPPEAEPSEAQPTRARPTGEAQPTEAQPTAPSPGPEPSGPAPSPTGPTAAPEPAPAQTAPASLRAGDRGEQVLATQERLSELGYWLGEPDGSFGELTRQAVFALQGAAGLQRDGVLGPRTRAALEEGVTPTASTSSGRAVEVDRDRGLVLFVDDGEVGTVLHTSTGTFETYRNADGEERLADTPGGTFAVSWVQRGWRDTALGRLYSPRYFHPDGIALHGSGSVPGYPASHGCARVTTAAMDMVWQQDLMPVGATVVVR